MNSEWRKGNGKNEPSTSARQGFENSWMPPVPEGAAEAGSKKISEVPEAGAAS